MRRASRPRVLILVQNLPVPFDRRVWLECQSLRKAGFDVAVVCPKGKGDPSFASLDGVDLYKYRPFVAKQSKAAFVAEYLYSFIATFWLAARASRHGRFAVIQSCNPPDILWPIGWIFGRIHGARFVFDHHDLCPELYESRFPEGSAWLHRALVLFERCTVQTADRVISTNATYRSIVIARHGIDPERVTVVRTGPDPDRLRAIDPDPSLKARFRYLVAYIGVMGPQDGVDLVLRVAQVVTQQLGRDDVKFVLMGSGDCFEELIRLRASLGVEGCVEMLGRVPDSTVAAVLSTADVGISPDPKNPLNDASTMNKTMEYMAYGLPVVAFDLRETRVSAGSAAVYATPNDIGELARLLVDLLDDEPRRREMGATGRARVVSLLAWSHQAPHYVEVYRSLVPGSAGRETEPVPA
ncbi:MAG: glycosyltransferase family 4 protein [Actinomycetota bacterium]|nr:glycosyltransferase family 4 protein [Actinomycetota bacterium]